MAIPCETLKNLFLFLVLFHLLTLIISGIFCFFHPQGKGVQTTYWLMGELKDQNGICDFKYQEITVWCCAFYDWFRVLRDSCQKMSTSLIDSRLSIFPSHFYPYFNTAEMGKKVFRVLFLLYKTIILMDVERFNLLFSFLFPFIFDFEKKKKQKKGEMFSQMQ